VWDRAEKDLKAAVEALDLAYTLKPGEGAFYGPKLDSTCAMRSADNGNAVPCSSTSTCRGGSRGVCRRGWRTTHAGHAAPGDPRLVERFIGILIEHYAGHFPLWLAPVQAVVASITDEAAAYAEEVAANCGPPDWRVVIDTSNEKIGYKVREHSLAKVRS